MTTKTFEFAIVLDGIPELNESVSNALFAAGCDDATPSMRQGQLYVTFARDATTLDCAIESATRDVKKAKIGGTIAMVYRDLRR